VEHIWSVICRLSITDRERGTVSLIDVTDRIDIEGEVVFDDEPVGSLPVPVEIISLWRRSNPDQPEYARARVLILSPENEPLNDAGYEYKVDLTQHSKFRSVGRLQTLPFTSSGIYRFAIQLFDEESNQWKDIAAIPLELVVESPMQNHSRADV
jgi:hypothetical protein